MKSDPRISVVMPVYNGERFVGAAIGSILRQTLPDFEFIIVDDGSTDTTARIVTDYANADDRIVLVRQPKNLGVIDALNKACRAAKGTFIARMDADDVSLPERFERQISFLSSHGDIGVLGTAVQVIDQDGRLGAIKRYPTRPGLVAWSLLFFNSLVHPSVMIRRDVIRSAGFYPTEWNRVEDYALFLRLSRNTRLANLPQVLLHYRTWEGSVSTRSSREQETNAVEALRQSITETTSRIATVEQGAALRGLSVDHYPATEAEIRALSDLICDLEGRFAGRPDLDKADVRSVRRDAAVKLWLLAGLALRRSPALAFAVAGHATMMRPSSFFEFLAKLARKFVR